MNILIVKAHPSPSGHVHRIAETYATAREAKRHTVKVVDLYSPKYECELLCFEDIRDMRPPALQKTFESQVAWADEIVMVHPVWWGLPPAVMKNWVDLTFWVHFAYRYMPDGEVKPMLKGKTAKIFATSGGPGWWYHLPFLPLISFWRTTLFHFVGIEVIDFKVCGNLDRWRGEKADRHFEKFLRKIQAST